MSPKPDVLLSFFPFSFFIETYEEDISRLKYEIAAKEERHTDEVSRTHDEYKNQLAQLEQSLQNQHLEQVETCKLKRG